MSLLANSKRLRGATIPLKTTKYPLVISHVSKGGDAGMEEEENDCSDLLLLEDEIRSIIECDHQHQNPCPSSDISGPEIQTEEEVSDDFTLVGEAEGPGNMTYMESSEYVASPEPGEVLFATTSQRSRLKKRTIENQLVAWRAGIQKCKVSKLRTVGYCGEMPPLVDCDEPESDRESHGAESDSRSLKCGDPIGDSPGIPSLVDCDERDSMRGSLGTGRNPSLDHSVRSSEEAESMASMAKFSPVEFQKLTRRGRRASTGCVSGRSISITTGGFISQLLFSDACETATEETGGKDRVPASGPSRKSLKHQRVSMDGNVPSKITTSNIKSQALPRRGSLNSFMSRPEQEMSRLDIQTIRAIVPLQSLPKISKSIVSSSTDSVKSGPTTDDTHSNGESRPRPTLSRENRSVLMVVSTARSSTNDSRKSAATGNMNRNRKSSSSSTRTDDKQRGIERQESAVSSTISYETLHSSSTKKQLYRTQSWSSLASSIESTEATSDETIDQACRCYTTKSRRKCKNVSCRDRRSSKTFPSTYSNSMPALEMISPPQGRRGSTGSTFPTPVTKHVDSCHLVRHSIQRAENATSLPNEPPFCKECRMSIGASIPPKFGNHVNSNHLTRTSFERQEPHFPRRMSTGTMIPEKFGNLMNSNHLRQTSVERPKHLFHKERRMSTGTPIPEKFENCVNSNYITRTSIERQKSQVLKERRKSTGALIPEKCTTHATRNHLAQKSVDSPKQKLVPKVNRRSTGPITCSLEEEIIHIISLERNVASSQRPVVSSVDVWKDCSATTCTTKTSSWISNGDKSSSTLSFSSSKTASHDLGSSRAVQSKQKIESKEKIQKSDDDTTEHTFPSRSRRIINALNIFRPNQLHSDRDRSGSSQRQRTSFNGNASESSLVCHSPEKENQHKSRLTRRRASTGAVTELSMGYYPSLELTVTSSCSPNEPVHFSEPKKSRKIIHGLCLGILRGLHK